MKEIIKETYRSECLELILYVNKLSNYLKECCE